MTLLPQMISYPWSAECPPIAGTIWARSRGRQHLAQGGTPLTRRFSLGPARIAGSVQWLFLPEAGALGEALPPAAAGWIRAPDLCILLILYLTEAQALIGLQALMRPGDELSAYDWRVSRGRSTERTYWQQMKTWSMSASTSAMLPRPGTMGGGRRRSVICRQPSQVASAPTLAIPVFGF